MRYLLRAAFGIAALGASLVALADSPWRINEGHSLIWQDKAYMPVGIRIPGTPEEINRAAAQGFRDVLVDLPVGGDGWTEAVAALQKNNLGFLISINSLANFSEGYSVEPDGYRITQFTEGKPISLTIPGASSVMAILASNRDGEILKTWQVKTPAGQFNLDIGPKPADENAILLLYPRMQSTELPDFYEGMDKQRDRLLESLRSLKSTTGLRGIVNPLGEIVKLPAPDIQFVPSSALFKLELSRYLENKYRNLETAEQTWSMRSSDIDSFDKMAHLVPLWSGTRGLPQLWDPTSNKLYPIDNRHSVAWTDIQDVINIAARRRFKRLSDSIHAVVQVPVVEEWAGWSIPYEGGIMVDGVGMQTHGTDLAKLMDGASRAASSVLRWDKERPGWLLATRVDFNGAKPGEIGDALDDLFSVGARGAFIQTDDPEVRKALASIAGRYSAGTQANDVVKAFYYPENATSPAAPMRMPGGAWWLPAPFSGNRLNLGSRVLGYRFNNSGVDSYVYWVASGELQLKLLTNEPKKAIVEAIDGSEVTTKVSKDGVTVVLNTVPIVVSGVVGIPVPDVSKEEAIDRMAKMLAYAEENHADISQETYVFQTSLQAFDRGPGGSYSEMIEAYDQVERRLAKYSWTEGETAQGGSLGQGVFYPGCSMNSAYRMHTSLNIPFQQYKIQYYVLPKTNADQEVWIAASIPPEVRKSIRVSVGTQVFSLPDPVAPYGLGFAWYHLGTTKLGTERASVAIVIDGGQGFDIAVDVVMITPVPFTPYGVRLPDPIDFGEKSTKPKGRKH